MRGLRFTCQTGCISCCTERGYVYLTERDLRNAAAFLGISRRVFEARYIYRTRHLLRLRKPRGSQCPFLEADGCIIHAVKPTQCRVFPFWPELAGSRREWRKTSSYCPGIGRGGLIPVQGILRAGEAMRTSYPAMYAD